ncbi:TIGR03745 family integrating conjugative element membrane protein [Pectobacterium carotovorum]|uniref:TIGR03745 family integrating conjugative element membrane protein n=1 Tax=Pectobacterium carotovorum TaxID=554 RepID=UPI001E45046F|nr:TIGR03745 family integrating conjugative element membrane protein [Pectobacterium carotovorum]UFT94982.1 TIGR03745 family integrating conjugative element membrane protein [Pectobacterium carotovorum]
MKIVSMMRRTTERLTMLVVLAGLYSGQAVADLPAIEAPSSGGGGGLFNTLKGYIKDGVSLAGLVVAAIAFLVVAKVAVSAFHDVRAGKADWGAFTAFIIIGVVLLVAVIWLATKALDIL